MSKYLFVATPVNDMRFNAYHAERAIEFAGNRLIDDRFNVNLHETLYNSANNTARVMAEIVEPDGTAQPFDCKIDYVEANLGVGENAFICLRVEPPLFADKLRAALALSFGFVGSCYYVTAPDEAFYGLGSKRFLNMEYDGIMVEPESWTSPRISVPEYYALGIDVPNYSSLEILDNFIRENETCSANGRLDFIHFAGMLDINRHALSRAISPKENFHEEFHNYREHLTEIVSGVSADRINEILGQSVPGIARSEEIDGELPLLCG